MASRHDDLAKRLAARLDKAPERGKAMRAGSTRSRRPAEQPAEEPAEQRAERAGAKQPTRQQTARKQPARKRTTGGRSAPKRSASGKAKPSAPPARRGDETPARPRRGSAGTVLRGHLVPDAIHRDARRRKAALRSQGGGRVTWDDVMCEGLELLAGGEDHIAALLGRVDRAADDNQRRRLVQATLPSELDDGFVMLHLDLEERPDIDATYERLWASAIVLWLDATE